MPREVALFYLVASAVTDDDTRTGCAITKKEAVTAEVVDDCWRVEVAGTMPEQPFPEGRRRMCRSWRMQKHFLCTHAWSAESMANWVCSG